MKSQKSPFGEQLCAQGYDFLTKRAKIKNKVRFVKKTSPSPVLSIIPVAKGRNFLCCVTIWRLMECNVGAPSIRGV